MKKTKAAGDIFLETFNHATSDKFERSEYDADTYYQLLIYFNVPITFNNQGFISASQIQRWSGSNQSFKRFLINSWGKNAKEGFYDFKNQTCLPYIEEKKEVWLSAYMAWEYAHYANVNLKVAYSGYIWGMFEDMADPEIMLDKELKGLQEEGYNMSNVTSITGKSYD